jgi:hypothetical protein
MLASRGFQLSNAIFFGFPRVVAGAMPSSDPDNTQARRYL